MKKKNLPLLFFFLCIYSYSENFFDICLSEMERYVQNESNSNFEYKVLYYSFGNFTNSGNKEAIVFFDNKKNKNAATVRLVKVFCLDDKNNILSSYTIDYSNIIVFKKRTYDCLPLGKRCFQGWICDLNGNGRQELILEFGYRDFVSIRIIEFDGGAFKELLELREEKTKVLDADVENGTLYLEREMWNAEERRNEKVRTKAVWNEEAGLYEETELETGRNINEFNSGID